MSSVAAAMDPRPDVAEEAGRPPAGLRRAQRLGGALAAAGRALRRPGLTAAWLVLAVVVVAALFPELFTSYSPIHGTGGARLKPPGAAHLFGTDQVGRDLFARVVYGTRESIKAVVLAVFVGLVAGSSVGLVAGYVGRWVDDVLMRVIDVLLAVPTLLVSLAIINAFGFGMVNIAVAVGIGSVAGFARVMRSEVIRIRGMAFVEATAFSGISQMRVLARHILPNAIGPVLVLATLELGWAILSVSALSFLGFGPPPPTPEWGLLVAGGRDFMTSAWWLTVLPGVVVMVTVVAANRVARSFDGRGHATL
jgi:peptide/nickel transport system permease protein